MDWQTIQPIFHWLSDHPVWSGLFVFLIALTESLIIVGLIVPGTVLMFGVGTLVGAGVLDVKLTLLLAFLGAVLGDGISFWIGATYREQIAGFWPFNKNPQILTKGKSFFRKHGGKSILFGRFVGPVRPVIPAIAGMMHMPARKFFLLNIVSALGWAPFYLIPGILFGTSIGLASAIGTRLLTILLVIFVSAVVLIFVLKKSMGFITPKLEGWFGGLLKWSIDHVILGTFIRALIDPQSEIKTVLSRSFLIIFFLFSIFFLLVFSIWSHWIADINVTVSNIMSMLRTAPGDEFMWFIQIFSSWLVFFLVFINVSISLFVERHFKALIYLLGLLVTSAFFISLLVFIYHAFTDTAVDHLALIHLTLFTTFILFCTVICSENFKQNIRWMFYALALLVIFLFSFSEIYFDQLSFSLVLIALFHSAFWLLLFSLAYRRHKHEVPSCLAVSISSVGVFTITSALMINSGFYREIVTTKSQEPVIISTDAWLESGWKELAAFRSDVFGDKKQPLNLQWQGTLSDIKQTMLNSHWQPEKSTSLKSVLYWLAPQPDMSDIVRLPQTHLGKTESVLFVKPTAHKNQQLVLQLWNSNILFENNIPLWVGSVSRQRLVTGERWLARFEIEDTSVSIFTENIKLGEHWKPVLRNRDKQSATGQTVLLLEQSNFNLVGLGFEK